MGGRRSPYRSLMGGRGVAFSVEASERRAGLEGCWMCECERLDWMARYRSGREICGFDEEEEDACAAYDCESDRIVWM